MKARLEYSWGIGYQGYIMAGLKSKSSLIGIGAAILVGGQLAYFWLSKDKGRATAPHSDLLVGATVTLAPGIHLLGAHGPSAAYVVETSAGLVLIDSCTEADAGPVLKELQVLGLDVSRLQAILLTHAHADHSLGARGLRELSGAKIYAGRGDCGVLRAGGPPESFFSVFFYGSGDKVHPTDIDEELSGGETITIGDARFAVLATPGHTPGSTCYLLERDGVRALFAGDVILSLSDSGPLSGLGTYAAYLSPRFRGNAKDFLASLKKLRELPVPDLVLPGHPRADAQPQSPRLTQEQWKALLDKGISDMQGLLERYARDGANFLDAYPKELLPGLYYWGNYGGSAVYGLVTPGRRLFVVGAPGGDGLPTFVNMKLRDDGLEGMKPSAVLLTSCSAESIGGLKFLVEKTGCAVVAPKEALTELKKSCPASTEFQAAEALEEKGWFRVEAIVLEGDDWPAAYCIHWADKTVVFTGRVPVKPTPQSIKDLFQSFGNSLPRVRHFTNSLEKLGKITPDLWLPAVSYNDQNASLYGREWAELIQANKGLVGAEGVGSR